MTKQLILSVGYILIITSLPVLVITVKYYRNKWLFRLFSLLSLAVVITRVYEKIEGVGHKLFGLDPLLFALMAIIVWLIVYVTRRGANRYHRNI